jgi:hypothetical protein
MEEMGTNRTCRAEELTANSFALPFATFFVLDKVFDMDDTVSDALKTVHRMSALR